jgi:hypothetical protein
MDTDVNGAIVNETDPEARRDLIADSANNKRNRMKDVCLHCHTPDYVNAFYVQYDDLVVLYNEKFAKSGKAIMDSLQAEGLLSATQFDEEIEWTWFYLWHHEGRRARHGASMMAPDYTHWHGMYEVAEHGGAAGARVSRVIDGILARPEHAWFERGAEEATRRIREAMEERYGIR